MPIARPRLTMLSSCWKGKQTQGSSKLHWRPKHTKKKKEWTNFTPCSHSHSVLSVCPKLEGFISKQHPLRSSDIFRLSFPHPLHTWHLILVLCLWWSQCSVFQGMCRLILCNDFWLCKPVWLVDVCNCLKACIIMIRAVSYTHLTLPTKLIV